MRFYTRRDKRVMSFDTLLNGVFSLIAPRTQGSVPGIHEFEASLSEVQRQDVIGMMRVNHSGEVCAQALYTGQALVAKDFVLQQRLKQAGREEEDHLNWTSHRLKTLGGHTSFLNPLWYMGAFTIGCGAGVLGDRWSLGFLQETENQVEAHLEGHLARLPEADSKSRAVITQMRDDEARHAQMAKENGAEELPAPIKVAMRAAAKVMTTLAYRI